MKRGYRHDSNGRHRKKVSRANSHPCFLWLLLPSVPIPEQTPGPNLSTRCSSPSQAASVLLSQRIPEKATLLLWNFVPC